MGHSEIDGTWWDRARDDNLQELEQELQQAQRAVDFAKGSTYRPDTEGDGDSGTFSTRGSGGASGLAPGFAGVVVPDEITELELTADRQFNSDMLEDLDDLIDYISDVVRTAYNRGKARGYARGFKEHKDSVWRG